MLYIIIILLCNIKHAEIHREIAGDLNICCPVIIHCEFT